MDSDELGEKGAFIKKLSDFGQLTTSLGPTSKTEGEERNDFKAAHSTHYVFISSFTSLKIHGIEGFAALILILGVGEMAYKTSLSTGLTFFNKLPEVWWNLTEQSSGIGSPQNA